MCVATRSKTAKWLTMLHLIFFVISTMAGMSGRRDPLQSRSPPASAGGFYSTGWPPLVVASSHHGIKARSGSDGTPGMNTAPATSLNRLRCVTRLLRRGQPSSALAGRKPLKPVERHPSPVAYRNHEQLFFTLPIDHQIGKWSNLTATNTVCSPIWLVPGMRLGPRGDAIKTSGQFAKKAVSKAGLPLFKPDGGLKCFPFRGRQDCQPHEAVRCAEFLRNVARISSRAARASRACKTPLSYASSRLSISAAQASSTPGGASKSPCRLSSSCSRRFCRDCGGSWSASAIIASTRRSWAALIMLSTETVCVPMCTL